MRAYICPICDTTQENSRMPPEYPWTGSYMFRCQHCATMLRLAPLRRRWIGYPVFVLMPVSMVMMGDSPPATLLAAMGGWVFLMIAIKLIPRDVVIHSRE